MDLIGSASDRASLLFAAPETQLDVVRRLRDSIGAEALLVRPERYRQILEDVVPVLIAVLKGGSPQFIQNTIQSLRATILDVLKQLPLTAELRGHAETIHNALVDVLNRDNEHNALNCLAMIADYHKAFHPDLESTVPHLIALYSSMYGNLPRLVASTFPVRPGTPNTPAPSPNAAALALGRASFRVLGSFERVVRLFAQIYVRFADLYLGQLVPVMIKALRSEVSERHALKMAQQFQEFTFSRVKTLSFLVFVARAYPDRMLLHIEDLCRSVFALLRSCPADAVNLRRDLLFSMRQMAALDGFCRGFRDKIDHLLRLYPQLMVGRGREAAHNLRHLAATVLIDLVNSLRSDLSLDQLSMAAAILCHHVHDASLPLALQSGIVKLLFNLVDPIYQKDKDEIGRPRKILVSIMYTIVSRLSNLQALIPGLCEALRNLRDDGLIGMSTPFPARPEDVLENASRDPVAVLNLHRDVKALVGTIMFGLKTVVWSIRNSSGQDEAQLELSMIRDVLVAGMRTLPIFGSGLVSTATTGLDPLSEPASADSVLDNFASVFTALDTRQFQSIFSDHIEDIVTFIAANEPDLPVFAFPQHFLQSASMCKSFADLLLCFLLQPEQIKLLTDSGSVAAKTRLNLFRIILHALTIYADVEFVIRPHLCEIVTQCLDRILSAEDPRAYFLVLRALFRNIGGGTFERLYKEFLPIMPELLNGLLTVIRSECARDVGDFAVELGLTVPARLSSLLPFIPSLIEIVAFALSSQTETIIKLGLRTLEFWIDNLDLDFLYPLIERNLKSIMLGLCALIHGHTTQFGPSAVRILGGLSGRGRQFLLDGLPNCVTYSSGCRGPRVFVADNISISLRPVVTRLGRLLFATGEGKPSSIIQSAADVAQNLLCALLAAQHRARPMNDSDLQLDSVAQDGRGAFRLEEERLFSQLLQSVLTANAYHSQHTSIQVFVQGLIRHFAIILGDLGQITPRFDALVFADVLLECSGSRDGIVSAASWRHLITFLDALTVVAGTDALCRPDGVIQHVFAQSGHMCHHANRHTRLAGVRILAELTTRLPVQWVHSNQTDLIRSLLFALRDGSSDCDLEIRRLTLRTLEQTIQACSHLDSDITLLVNNISSELTSSTGAVRECAQVLLDQIARLCRTSVCDLLRPFRSNLLTPVLSRRLHTLAPSTRIGYISATAYALSIEPPLLDVTPEFFDMLVSLATEIRHDESTTLAGNPSISPSSSQSGRSRLLMLQRVESIKLLSAALKSSQLQRQAIVATPVTPDPASLLMDTVMSPSPVAVPVGGAGLETDAAVANLRNRIVAALFESLRSPHEEVAQAANRGMALACEQERPPKALLQSCLRPVLSNFAEYQKLSVPLLTMLSRLLSVLSKCFNVTLAQKLFEHLENFARMVVSLAREVQTPSSSAETTSSSPGNAAGAAAAGNSAHGSQQRFGQWNEVLIPSAILNTFHLLPHLPSTFLHKLILIVVQLEAIFPLLQVFGGIGHGPRSPYRQPLIRFLNHADYCMDAAAFFLQPANLSNPAISSLFKDCLRVGPAHADRLIKAVRDALPQLMSNAFSDGGAIPEPAQELRYQAITIIDILSSYDITGCEIVLERLVAVWDQLMARAATADLDQDLIGTEIGPIVGTREIVLLAKIFIRFCKAQPMSTSVYLWKLLTYTVIRPLSDPDFLIDFIVNDVVGSEFADMVLLTFLNQLARTPASYAIKSKALDMVVTPIIQRFVSEKRDLNQHVNVAANVLPPILTGYSSLPDYFNTSLATLAIHLVLPSKSDPLFHASLLQYIWANCARDHTQAQLRAYIALARFLGSRPPGISSLESIRLSLLIAVLGVYQAESRTQVHTILAAILPGMSAMAAAKPGTFPEFVLWTRRLLSSSDANPDPGPVRHLLHAICAFRVQFQPYRAVLIPSILSIVERRLSAGRLTSSDFLQTALDCIGTILLWAEDTIEAIGDINAPDLAMLERDMMSPVTLGDISLLPALLQIAPDSPAVARRRTSSLLDVPMGIATEYTLAKIGVILVDLVINMPDQPSLRFMRGRAQQYLRQFAVQHGGSTPVGLQVLFASAKTSTEAQRICSLDLITDLAKSAPASCTSSAPHIIGYWRASSQSDNIAVRAALDKSVSAVLPLLLLDVDAVTELQKFVEHGLAQTSSVLYAAVHVVHCAARISSHWIQNHAEALARVSIMLARECLSSSTSAAEVQSQSEPGPVGASLLVVLEMLVSLPHLAPEPHQALLQTITLVTERSNDLNLIEGVITVLNSWAQNTLQFDSTRSEIDQVVGRLVRRFLPSIKTSLESRLLSLLLTCADSGLLLSPSSIIPPMLLGLACSDVTLRTECVSRVQRHVLIHNTAEVDLTFALLKFVFGDEHWELCCTKGNVLWAMASLQLILSMTSSTGTVLIADTDMVPDEDVVMAADASGGRAGRGPTPVHTANFTFVETLSGLRPKNVLQSLSDLAVLDGDLARCAWAELFPQIWSGLSSTQRAALQPLINTLLTRDWHRGHRTAANNVVQILLECFVKCGLDSPPNVPSELLGYLGRTYNCWYSALALLQRQAAQIDAYATFAQTCSLLNERDVLAGLWYSLSQVPVTRSALALQQFGLWPRAQTMFFAALASVHGQTDLAPNVGVPLPTPGSVSALEMNMWESEWTYAAMQLGQWDALAACAQSHPDRNAQTLALLKSGTWSEMFEDAPRNPEEWLWRLYLAVVNRDSDLEQITECTMQSLLSHWSSFPPVVTQTHIPLLAQFHDFVEAQETNAIIADLSQSKALNKPADLGPILKKWRQRLPNDWEDLSLWLDRVRWRLKAFDLIQQQITAGALPVTTTKTAIPSTDDRIWTLLTLAKVARKQQLMPQCLYALSQTVQWSDVPITTADAFVRLREQIRVCMGSSIQYKEALALVNSLNIDYFAPEQKAELFRLKGDSLQHLGQGDDANACFSTALSVCETHGKSWLSWANFCDRVFAMKKDREWATWAVSCYMNAIAYGEPRARLMITRVIWLLSYDADDRSVVGAFERACDQVPLWTWLLWLPQLLTCLARSEGPAVKVILQRIARIYPQALHYTVRAFLFEKREQHAISVKDGAGPDKSAAASQETSLSLVEAIVVAMRENHPSLVTEIENMLEEINLRFQPTPHEELLASVHSLYQKCFKQAVMVSGLSGPIPEPLAGVLARLARSFFNSPKHVSNPIQSEFVRRYKQAFEADFSLSTSRVTLSVLLGRLSKWKSHLEFHVTQRRRMALRLELLSPYLMRFQTYEVEVPGQYLLDREPSTDQNVLIVRFEPSVAIVRLSHTYLYRRLSLLGTDGITYHFLVQYSIAHINRSDERMMQLYTIMNRLMSRYKETRRRHLQFAVPLVVPLTHRLRLMETHNDVTSFEKIYEQGCHAHRISPDAPFAVVLDELGRVSELNPANVRSARLNSFKRIMGNVIPRTLLSDYFHSVIADQALLWAFRKQFAQQIGLNCFLSYILSIGDRSLHKILLQQRNGRITFNDFYPSYNALNMIETSDSVPFRLTPNISTFIGDYMIHGVTAATLVSLSACLLKHQDVLKNYLYLFVRDDILSWHATKKTVQTDSAQRALEYDVRLQISSNTLQILRGIQSFMSATKSDGEEGQQEPITAKVAQLIDQAMSEDNLSNQLPTWHPWF